MKTLTAARSILAIVALTFSLGLVACFDGGSSTAPPPPYDPATNPTGNSNGGGKGKGNGGTPAPSVGTIIINGNGYVNEKLVPATTTYYASYGMGWISMGGAWKGQSYALTLSQGTGVGRYVWNTLAGNMVAFSIAPSGQYTGVRGETVIEEVDVRNGLVRGTFSGIVAHTLDTSVQVEISGTFEAAITF